MNEDVKPLKDTLEYLNTRKSKSRRIITEKFEKFELKTFLRVRVVLDMISR